MIYPKIKVKNARITKHRNPFYDELHYDYFLRLDEKLFNKFRDTGLPAKSIKNFAGEDVFFIKVTPMWEFDPYGTNKKIPKPDEEDFLEKDNIDITFNVYIKDFDGHVIKKLYFAQSGIEKKGDK